MVGWIADSWAEKMVVVRVVSSVGWMTGWLAVTRAVQMAMNWVDNLVDEVTVCWAMKMVMTSVGWGGAAGGL